jgi:hypothetical protein
MRFPIKKNTFSRHGGTLKPSPLQPVLPLVLETLPTKEQDKSKFISFELKSRAGQLAGSTTYKKFVWVFEEGTPQQWIDLIHDLEEIWTQKSKLISECEAIERNETSDKKHKEDDDNYYNRTQKNKFGNPQRELQKMVPTI